MSNLVSLTNPSLQILGKTGQSITNMTSNLNQWLNLNEKHGNVKKIILQKLKTALEHL